MIFIRLRSRMSGLPLPARTVQVIFTDAFLGWLRPEPTNAEGFTTIFTRPGPVRLYIDGEFFCSCRLQTQNVFLLETEELARAQEQEARPQVPPTLEEQWKEDGNVLFVPKLEPEQRA